MLSQRSTRPPAQPFGPHCAGPAARPAGVRPDAVWLGPVRSPRRITGTGPADACCHGSPVPEGSGR